MEWAESSSEPMKSRLYNKDYFCINLYLKSGVHLTDIFCLSVSSTKDPLWFNKAPIYGFEHYINCLNKTEIAIR